MSPRRTTSCTFWPLLLLLFALGLTAVVVYTPRLAVRSFGPPAPGLGAWSRFVYGLRLLWYAGDLTTPRLAQAPEQDFVIEPGESLSSVVNRLEQAGVLRNGRALRAYLIWSGQDTGVQAGTYRLSASMTALQVARALQSPAPGKAVLVVLAGWRMEEVAAALPSSGLQVSPEEFLAAARQPPAFGGLLPAGASAEGFLFPDQYVLPRETDAEALLVLLVQNFAFHLTPELRQGFARQGLDVYQAVTLASLIEREAMVDEEMPLIASVFYNRLAVGMTLGSDASVQYALGYNHVQNTWWTNPLSSLDLEVDSPYNTYRYPGLPPGPICSPSLAALQAVASPANTPYFYFRARCDGSGRHFFAETYEEHQRYACP
jgi:UPF0755 protein